MNPCDSFLLHLLEPGEFLRIGYAPDKDGRVRVSLEGGGGSGSLGQRIEAALGGLRASGYAFGRTTRWMPGERAGTEDRWVEIRPRSDASPIVRRGALGFGTERAETAAELRLPRVDGSMRTGYEPGPMELISTSPGVVGVEIDFKGQILSHEEAAQMDRALELRSLAARAMPVPASLQRPSCKETYLALWLLHRIGWDVTLRVGIADEYPVPTTLLELAGRAFFLSESEVVESSASEFGPDAKSLSGCFPKGWPFPRLLPDLRDLDSLAANRLHNRHLPRLPKDGLVIGVAEGRRVRLPSDSRDRHTYIVGATGTGKSTLLERMIVEDIRRGEGVVLLDPHGDLFHRIRESVPASRQGDLFCLDPSSEDQGPGFNIFDLTSVPSELRQRRAALIVGELLRLFEEIWNMREAGGPMFELYFRNAIYLAMLQKEESVKRLHLGHLSKIFQDGDFRKELISNCEDGDAAEFWTKMAEKVNGDCSLANIAPYIVSKVNSLVQGGYIRNLLCRDHNELRLGERIDGGRIVLVNLDKGRLGSHESRLLGTLLMSEIFSAGLSRSAVPESARRPVNLYVDEFQNFVSDNVASMLSEARKFGLRLTLANQTLAQLKAHSGRQDLLETVLGNVGNLIAFRLGVPDAERLRLFLDPFTSSDLQEMPNFTAFARLLTSEGPIRPLVFRTLRARKLARTGHDSKGRFRTDLLQTFTPRETQTVTATKKSVTPRNRRQVPDKPNRKENKNAR